MVVHKRNKKYKRKGEEVQNRNWYVRGVDIVCIESLTSYVYVRFLVYALVCLLTSFQ